MVNSHANNSILLNKSSPLKGADNAECKFSCILSARKITARFWAVGDKERDQLLEALKEHKPSFITYGGTVDPYRHFKGKVLFIFTGSELEKFHKIVAAIPTGNFLTEILINDEWFVIRQPLKTVQTQSI